MYDIAAAYRIYPRVSKEPFIHRDDKLKLTEIGIYTFKQSLGSMKAKIFFILDDCPIEYEQMILKYFQQQDIEFVRIERKGNLFTFGQQIDILLSQKHSEIIYFAEDDYIYRPDLLKAAINFIASGKADFVTPYDHVDSYTMAIHTQNRYEIVVESGLHWRTSASTCLTFLTTKNNLKKTQNTFRSYCKGNLDASLWMAITKFNLLNPFHMIFFKRLLFAKIYLYSWYYNFFQVVFGKKYKLWQPIPSIATHMEKSGLAPNIDWKNYIDL